MRSWLCFVSPQWLGFRRFVVRMRSPVPILSVLHMVVELETNTL